MESKDTQLPAEVLESIELKAEHEAALQFHPVYSPDQNTACRICYRNGAKEYATLLHQAKDEIDVKANEIERLRRIVSKHKSGRTYQEQKSRIENMCALLEKFISRHEAGLLPDRFIYNEIKTFLDGTI